MYLTRLTLNPRTRRVQRELANPYELHRTLMSAFPAELPAGERVLYRVDVDPRTGTPSLLLQSHTRPDWAWLGNPGARDYLMVAPETKAFDLTFTPGQTLAFRLRANPTVKRWLPKEKENPDSAPKPMRVPVTGDDELSAWLQRQGNRGGFRVANLTVRDEGNVNGWQRSKNTRDVDDQNTDDADPAVEGGARSERRKLTFRAVTFEGVLQVTEPDTLWQTVQRGIGPGKSFGFGLLSLARG